MLVVGKFHHNYGSQDHRQKCRTAPELISSVQPLSRQARPSISGNNGPGSRSVSEQDRTFRRLHSCWDCSLYLEKHNHSGSTSPPASTDSHRTYNSDLCPSQYICHRHCSIAPLDSSGRGRTRLRKPPSPDRNSRRASCTSASRCSKFDPCRP